jgi:beta-lactamase regulating signal transducer with metallopeptidase domain
MVNFAELMQQYWVYALGWTLFHSLWQSALVAIAGAGVLQLTKQATANFRYLLAFVCLILCVLISAVTFYRYLLVAGVEFTFANDKQFLALGPMQSTTFDVMAFVYAHINVLSFLWLLGFSAYLLKALRDYAYCQQLKHKQLVATPEHWQHIFNALCERVGITRAVELRLSAWVQSPCVIGHLKPVVLLPASVVLRMTQAQIEAILLHELAHVRRNDYLVALMQTTIKTLYFFNPFLLWISGQMDKEREHACDDIAVGINQDPLLFANTLKEFAVMTLNVAPSLNIQGNKLLMSRITRLFAPRGQGSNPKNTLLATLVIVLAGGVGSLCVNASDESGVGSEKIISVKVENLPPSEAFAAAIAQVNEQCGTQVKIAPISNNEGVRMLNLPAVTCANAIARLTGDAAIENVVIPPNGKRVNIKFDNHPVADVMAEVNKQCGTDATVAENMRDALVSFQFEDIPCEKIIPLIQNFK